MRPPEGPRGRSGSTVHSPSCWSVVEHDKLLAERDRLQAENAALARALRYAHDTFVCSSTCHRTEPAVCDVLAAHAARTQEGPR